MTLSFPYVSSVNSEVIGVDPAPSAAALFSQRGFKSAMPFLEDACDHQQAAFVVVGGVKQLFLKGDLRHSQRNKVAAALNDSV